MNLFFVVGEVPVHLVAASLPRERFGGMFAVVSKDGTVITTAAPQQTDPGTVARTMSVYRHWRRDDNGAFRWMLGQLIIRERFGVTDWDLLYIVQWRTMLAELDAPLATTSLVSVGIIVMIWTFLLLFDHRIFRPMLTRSVRVFESEHLSRTLIETAPVGLALIDLHSATPLIRSLAMTDLESAVDAPTPDLAKMLVARYVRRQKKRPIVGRLARNRVIHDTLTLARRDGRDTIAALRLTQARYQGKDVLVVALTDVTAERELQRKMLEARRAAESANAAKSAFLAATSHEIRTPLHGILGNLELLGRTPLSIDQLDRLNLVRQTGKHLVALINDILDFTRIESGEMWYERIPFDVFDVAERSLMLAAPSALEKSLALLCELRITNARMLIGDPNRIEQILRNLLSNAIKFTHTGKITLTLEVVHAEPESQDLVLSVTDTGIGISPEQQAHVFEAFRQADETIARRYGGTGLGLSLCKRFAEGMHGTLTLRSTPDIGSRFTVRIPLSSAPADAILDRANSFRGWSVIFVATPSEWHRHILPQLAEWGLVATTFHRLAEVSDDALANADAVIVYGDRADWSADDETRLLEQASNVIVAFPAGAARPIRTGRLVSLSCYSVDGLYEALCLIATAPSVPDGCNFGHAHEPADRRPPLDLSVLVAEDNAANGHLIDEQLRAIGCRVRVTGNGAEALALLAHDSFDILLTDLSMPIMDGHHLAREARRRNALIPIIAISAHVSQDEHAHARDASIAHTLIKPVSIENLYEALQIYVPSGRMDATPTLVSQESQPTRSPELHEIFAASVRRDLTALRTSCSANDRTAFCSSLHSLKGCLGAYGWTQLALRGQDIERKLDEWQYLVEKDDFEAWLQDVEALISTPPPR
ncbi:response regulator [Burkholderia humptydooensis]|uniref:Virulence sensor protein BvgS n=3 Tax=Burkholderia humptydooensis TaxID=430531 RepID=A0A7T2U8V7_9BURK|nr:MULTISPECIES: ATP-binding protein [Burkholderia]QPS47782.1 response regulator [Burkholderia humptydooensis]